MPLLCAICAGHSDLDDERNNILLLFEMHECTYLQSTVLSRETFNREVEITLDINLNEGDLLWMLYRRRTKQTDLKYKYIQIEVKYQEKIFNSKLSVASGPLKVC